MNDQKQHKTNELVVSLVLQIGVAISSAIILLGVILFFVHSHQIGSYHQFTSPNYSFPHSISELKTSIKNGDGAGFIELGVLLLIFTPILRVATSILLFKRQKDVPMTTVTLFVLLVLIGSFILGITVK